MRTLRFNGFLQKRSVTYGDHSYPKCPGHRHRGPGGPGAAGRKHPGAGQRDPIHRAGGAPGGPRHRRLPLLCVPRSGEHPPPSVPDLHTEPAEGAENGAVSVAADPVRDLAGPGRGLHLLQLPGGAGRAAEIRLHHLHGPPLCVPQGGIGALHRPAVPGGGPAGGPVPRHPGQYVPGQKRRRSAAGRSGAGCGHHPAGQPEIGGEIPRYIPVFHAPGGPGSLLALQRDHGPAEAVGGPGPVHGGTAAHPSVRDQGRGAVHPGGRGYAAPGVYGKLRLARRGRVVCPRHPLQ